MLTGKHVHCVTVPLLTKGVGLPPMSELNMRQHTLSLVFVALTNGFNIRTNSVKPFLDANGNGKAVLITSKDIHSQVSAHPSDRLC